jgi:predicted acylesterase/phospholipase RssA
MSQYGRSGRYALLTDELEAADVVVTPQTVRTRLLDFDRKAENILAGETAGREALAAIRERIAEVAALKIARRK